MLTKKHIILKIKESTNLLDTLGLLQAFINDSLLGVNKNFNKVALDGSSTYEKIYLKGLEENHYNFILSDYSYFQFNFIENDEVPHTDKPAARYAFYPNPFANMNEEFMKITNWYNDNEISFEEYTQAISEYQSINHVPAVRYDLSFRQYRRLHHPVAHFHFGIAENTRIATDKIFSPYLFVMLIIKMYYADYWNIISDDENEFELDQLMVKEKKSSTTVATYGCEHFCSIQGDLLLLS